jgi:hypothetical protein
LGSPHAIQQVASKLLERRSVCIWSCPQNEVDALNPWEYLEAHDFP